MTPQDLAPTFGTYWRLIEVDPSGCWAWDGRYKGLTPVCKWRGREATVARALWEITHGAPPPKGRAVVRKCGRMWCCNPKHLRHKGEPVVVGEVVGYCRNGHPKHPRNMYMYRDQWLCKTCIRATWKRRRKKQRKYPTHDAFREAARERAKKMWREGRGVLPPRSEDHRWRRDEKMRLGQGGAVG